MRTSGVLMPVTSLPSPWGVGTLGAAARDFIDFLARSGQSYWQVLPVGPTGFGDSPYQSFSTFAGNPYLVDLDDLAAEGLLEPAEYEGISWGEDPERVDYGTLYRERFQVLGRAVDRLMGGPRAAEVEAWASREGAWVEDYALYMAIKTSFDGKPWSVWPQELRLREPEALAAKKNELAREVAFWRGVQFLFHEQWKRFHAYAKGRGIQIIGDVPIYVAEDSADVWARPDVFQLDDDLRPIEVAGCPPDGFSATGQLWGNPLFDWEALEADGFRWWIDRVAYQFGLFDVLRIDHFRGLDSYYAIPFGDEDACGGRWRPGPGIKLIQAINAALGPQKIIAEDLGFLTPSVHQLLAESGYPGMKVLQFAFDSRDGGASVYAPHNIPAHCIAYVGTHDNETARGWLDTADLDDVACARDYLGLNEAEGEVWGLMRGIWASPAETAIVCMQDLLELGSEARINTPSTLGGNWLWRVLPGYDAPALERRLRRLMALYDRAPRHPALPKPGTPSKDSEETTTMTLTDLVQEELSQAGVTSDPTPADLQRALTAALRDLQLAGKPAAGERKLYYFSAEFLVGRLLRANLINLDLVDEAERIARGFGLTLAEVEEAEPEPSLGNGGLGRLAACFMDSIASLGLRGDGVGLNYHYGLFRQDLSSGAQVEHPDPWIYPQNWLIDTGVSFPVAMGDITLNARLLDIEVPGYENGVVNRLHLFDVEDPAPAPEHGIDFDKNDVAHCLTSFLYPDDSDEAGRILRVRQQYFMVSAGAQLILSELEAAGHAVEDLDRYVAVQINDTHPSMIIPELIRLLMERGMAFEDAVAVVERTCNYTNHTILAEALEKWPRHYLETVAPAIVPVIRQLDQLARTRTADESLAIWDADDVIHMAHMDVHFSAKVNGVAALHTQILEETEMHGFFELYPQKFNNKTNGITFRRWLMGANPGLSQLITKSIGEDWKRDASRLEALEGLADDAPFLEQLRQVKRENKQALATWLRERQGVEVDPEGIFDVQIKRLHQYKRQQMNALYAIWKYLQIKGGAKPARPLTMIFGAKAAPAYTLAKDTIHLILCLQKLIAADPEVSPYLQVVMVENYNVSAAEKLIPAADISEQISLASKEASGTGNMKFMANGALTLGTVDGANVEISELVGRENIYLFGRSSAEVIDLYARDAYRPSDYWQDGQIAPLVDFILSPELLALGDAGSLTRLYKDFIAKDYFMALVDLSDYIATKERMLADYEDAASWGAKTVVNIARSGYFSSDRTIAEYNRDIWHL